MERFIIVLLISYIVWLLTYFNMDKRPSKSEPTSDKSEPPPPQNEDSIIGKSKFKMQRSVPNSATLMPLDAREEKGEDIPNMPTTFAPQSESKRSSKVADENMDSAFSDTRMATTPTTYSDDDDDYDGVPNDEYATGSTFDEIGESMETIKRDDATPEQQRKAGKIFSELEGTALFEKIISDLPERRRVILDLIDKLYSEPQSEATPQTKKRGFKPLTTADEFNIRDYV